MVLRHLGGGTSSSGGGGIATLPVSEGAGGYVGSPYVTEGTGSTVLNRLHYTPMWVTRTVTVNQLACEVTVVGAATAVMRMGLYASHATEGRPGALLVDAGTVDTAAAIGVKTATLPTPQVLTPGVYWLAGVMQGATSTVRTITAAPYVLLADTLSSTKYLSRIDASTTGALPANAGSGAGTNKYSVSPPLIFAHVTAIA